jgi:hypothetical protein
MIERSSGQGDAGRAGVMKRPVGLLVIIAWCLLRGLAGIWGTVVLVSYAREGIGRWSDVGFVFAFEAAIWLWLALGLLIRWNLARVVALIWCGIIIVWSSYGFFSVALHRWNDTRYGGVWLATVLIHGGIILYFSRRTIARLFTVEQAGPNPGVSPPQAGDLS